MGGISLPLCHAEEAALSAHSGFHMCQKQPDNPLGVPPEGAGCGCPLATEPSTCPRATGPEESGFRARLSMQSEGLLWTMSCFIFLDGFSFSLPQALTECLLCTQTVSWA